ncbi:MAG: hypothetical protein EXS31_17605 [Pedosphaera sp.]|nr:hypothetical protein [Pedosphaera sp.]
MSNYGSTPTLSLQRDRQDGFDVITVESVLQTGAWSHIAAVCGTNTLKLYLDGILLREKFARILAPTEMMPKVEKRNLLGRSNWKPVSGNGDPELQGQMDEVRVWAGERTVGQILANMHFRLSGKEPGLIALLNFDDPANPGRNAANAAANAVLNGNARSMPAELPKAEHVLELDGKDGYVELPAGIFDELTDATVEMWARWESMGPSSTLFDYGEDNAEMVIGQIDGGPHLRFRFNGSQRGGFQVNELLRLKEWCHIAAVSGRGGMALYFNGVLVQRNELPYSFATIPNGKNHFLGRNTASIRDPSVFPLFQGQLDEVRVWKAARTAEQIRANMNQSLTGSEPGLFGLWNFENVENGVVKDATPAAHHGRLMGNARVVSTSAKTLSGGNDIKFFAGTVRDPAGKLMTNATVTVLSGMNESATATTDANGRFAFAGRVPAAASVDLRVTSGDQSIWLLDHKSATGESELNLTLAPGCRASESYGCLQFQMWSWSPFLNMTANAMRRVKPGRSQNWPQVRKRR